MLKSMEIVVSARNLRFNESFKINCIISTGIPNLRVWCKKWESDKKSNSQCC